MFELSGRSEVEAQSLCAELTNLKHRCRLAEKRSGRILKKMQEQRKTQTQKKREDHDTDKHAKDRSDKFEEHFQAQAPHSKVLLHANRYS